MSEELKNKIDELLCAYRHLHDMVTGGEDMEHNDIYYEVKELIEKQSQ